MCCTPDMVEFENNGEEIYVKKTDCPLVKHWARKYQAKVKVASIPKLGSPLLFDSDVEHVAFMAPGSEVERGDTVWAVPSSTMGVLHDAPPVRHRSSKVRNCLRGYSTSRSHATPQEASGMVHSGRTSLVHFG